MSMSQRGPSDFCPRPLESCCTIQLSLLIYPIVIIIVWAFTCKTPIRKLIVVQKGANRFMAGADYSYPTKQLFRNLNLLNIE